MIFSSSSPLLNRIIFRTFFAALGFGFITIGLTYYAGYRYQVSEVKNHLQSLVQSQYDVLVNNIWNFDHTAVVDQLNGMLSHPDIYYIRLDLNKEVISAGKSDLEKKHGTSAIFKLTNHTQKGSFHLGTLYVHVSYENVLKRIKYGYFTISCALAGALVGICLFVYLLFHKLFYRHLNRIVSFAEDLNINTLDTPLHLQRKGSTTKRGDELQLITDAFNNMRQRLLEGVREKQILQEDRSLLEQVIEQSDNATLITDDRWRIRYVNKALLTRMGCTRKESINRDVATFLQLMPNILSYDKVLKVINSGNTWYTHIAVPTDEEKHTEEDIRITAIQSQKGRQTHFVIVITDVTKEWALEKQLLQAQKMESIGTLAGGIAHDFNNLLSVILGYAEIIRMESREGLFHRETDQIIQAGNRAKALVKQILTFSRETDTEFKPILLQSILREVEGMLEASLPSSIHFSMDIDDSVPAVPADEGQLHQVLMNLCTNSKQALIDDKGTIRVSLKVRNIRSDFRTDPSSPALHPGSYAVISVKDNGCGMDEGTLSRIFDPFYTTKKQNEGTGLGLSVVHGIIKKHKGEIIVSSKPGRGTVFEIFIPTTKTLAETSVPQAGEVRGGTERIMIVDDDPSVLEMLKKGLADLGYDIAAYQSSGHALSTFSRHPDEVDLVITDMIMPNMTGDILAMQLRRIAPEIPLILCTGYSENIDEIRAADLGIDRFILKPVIPSELALAVREVLDNRTSS